MVKVRFSDDFFTKMSKEDMYMYKLCFDVENMCCPAGNKARIPREPHHHQKNKETQDAYLSK